MFQKEKYKEKTFRKDCKRFPREFREKSKNIYEFEKRFSSEKEISRHFLVQDVLWLKGKALSSYANSTQEETVEKNIQKFQKNFKKGIDISGVVCYTT